MLLLKQMCPHFCRAIFLGRSLHLPNAMCFSSWRVCETNSHFLVTFTSKNIYALGLTLWTLVVLYS